jgi:hypothetical protein
MIRPVSIDLRRSAAPGAGLALLVLGLIAMYLFFGLDAWSGRWSPMAGTLRTTIGFTWPLTLAAGAWLVGRDRRGQVGELFASSARPAWQRVAPPAAALTLTVSAAYLLTVAACVPQVAGSATYFNPAAVAVIAVGLLLLIAAALLGMGLGKLLPSRFTAPALALVGLFISSAPGMLYLHVSERTQARIALLSPILAQNGDFVMVPARLSLAQSIWAIALAVTGYLLVAGRGWRVRAAAALPTLIGVAAALAMQPSSGPSSSVVAADAGAQELICADGAPRVCVRPDEAAVAVDQRVVHAKASAATPPPAVGQRSGYTSTPNSAAAGNDVAMERSPRRGR